LLLLKAVIFDLCGITDNSSLLKESSIPFLNQLVVDLQKNKIRVVNLTSAFHQSDDRSLAYSFVLKQLQVHSSECVTITDTFYGLLSARNNGTTCIGYHNPQIAYQDLFKAAILVEGFEEVDYCFINRIFQYDHMEAVTILATPNFIIRELSVDDIEDLSIIYNEPSIRVFVSDFNEPLGLEKEKLKAYIKNIYHFYGYGLWGVFFKETNQLVGRCGVEYKHIDDEDIYELGYLLAKQYQGFGYAKEFVTAVIHYCFLELNLPYLIAIIDIDNLPSIHLAERVGMLRVGTCIRNTRTCYKYKTTNNLIS
jgi:RimJ/RimL family protein N-acetyltransferase